MPLGFQRLNERTQRPNANINFIKPLDGADKDVAQDFLERIAAQCYPIMKEHYLSVMSLEEYPPNPEFLGRNFNAGEVIQLVLKDRSGRWLSFKFVQMVMMHELAHCKQMNHSRFFWGVRNGYAKQMEDLWAKRYTGEGMWGRGKNLTTGAFVHDSMPNNAQIPEHLCGGTYRRARGRKRKRGQGQGTDGREKLSYAERQQKRIARKFGKHGEGNALGDDELVRGALETKSGGKRHSGKPRVANSKRGRELRANAALARFESAATQKIKEETPEIEEDYGSETESDYWSGEDEMEYQDVIQQGSEAGQIKDLRGKDLVRVCGDEGKDEGGQEEVNELRALSGNPKGLPEALTADDSGLKPSASNNDDSETESEPDGETARRKRKQQEDPSDSRLNRTEASRSDSSGRMNGAAVHTSSDHPPSEVPETPDAARRSLPTATDVATPSAPPLEPNLGNGMASCPVCSLENDPGAPTCIACANVLKPKLVKHTWRCASETCRETKYVNAGDMGRCGLCGTSKPADPVPKGNHSKAVGMGFIDANTLRWD